MEGKIWAYLLSKDWNSILAKEDGKENTVNKPDRIPIQGSVKINPTESQYEKWNERNLELTENTHVNDTPGRNLYEKPIVSICISSYV